MSEKTVEIFRPPAYARVRATLPSDLVNKLDEFVAFVKTQGEWEAENACQDNVLEYIVEQMLQSSSREMVAFRKAKKTQNHAK
ncbi:MAG TPA: hypothetical protein VLA12_18300 [Planctomycetaceae bacterium]|nr:hypothetical protein [Planctomycetaceae bacterium]